MIEFLIQNRIPLRCSEWAFRRSRSTPHGDVSGIHDPGNEPISQGVGETNDSFRWSANRLLNAHTQRQGNRW